MRLVRFVVNISLNACLQLTLESVESVLRYDCLLNTVRGGNGRNTDTGKPERKMLDLLMEQEDKKISYQELKRRAEHRTCHHHQVNSP